MDAITYYADYTKRARPRALWKLLSSLTRAQGYFISGLFIDRKIVIIELDGPNMNAFAGTCEGMRQALAWLQAMDYAGQDY